MRFNYKATDNSGKKVLGSIDAKGKDSAVKELQDGGFIVTEITEGEPYRAGGFSIFIQRVTLKDIYILARQMATLFSASIPAHRALVLTATQTENATLREILFEVSDDVKKGMSISNAFSKHSQFSSFFTSMLAVGEESGTLTNSLNTLADYYERVYELTSKVKGALVYPFFVILTFIGVMWFLLAFVIPQITEVLTDSGAELPFITEIVIGLSTFVSSNALLLAFVFFVLVFLVYKYVQTPSGGVILDTIKLRAPLFGELFISLYVSRIARMLGLMLSSGVRLLRATEIVSDVVGNRIYKEILLQANTQIKNGVNLSAVFAVNKDYVPPIITQMVKIGEETGQLGGMLTTISTFFERNLQNIMDTLIKLIEPVLLVLLGFMVAFLLAAVLLPLYSLSGQL